MVETRPVFVLWVRNETRSSRKKREDRETSVIEVSSELVGWSRVWINGLVDLGQKLFGLIVEIVLEVVAEDQVHDRGLSGERK